MRLEVLYTCRGIIRVDTVNTEHLKFIKTLFYLIKYNNKQTKIICPTSVECLGVNFWAIFIQINYSSNS